RPQETQAPLPLSGGDASQKQAIQLLPGASRPVHCQHAVEGPTDPRRALGQRAMLIARVTRVCVDQRHGLVTRSPQYIGREQVSALLAYLQYQ
ncbi:MAG: hypothetical protein ACE5MG_07815, partial [Candidatus Methylomirabilales bacterium]